MGRKNNIWIISQYTGSKYHGMNYRSYYLAKEMVAMGNKVRIFASSYSHLFHTLPTIKGTFTHELLDGIDYTWVKTMKYSNSRSIGRILSMFHFIIRLFQVKLEKLEKPDVIIVSSMSSFPIFIGKRWANKTNAKLFFEVRDLWPLTPIELGNVSKKNPFIKFLQFTEDYAYRNANKVISVLPGAKEYMVKHGLKNDKFVYIPNGIDLKEYSTEKDCGRKKIKLPPNKFIIGYVGSLGIANAINYFVEAAILLKDATQFYFVVVGSGDNKEELISVAKRNNLDNIIFHESIKKSEVQSVLRCFDVCYIGWRDEKIYEYGISANKIYDYMLSERPIIHSCNAFNDPIVDANCGISIAPENPDGIVGAIQKLKKMTPEERKELGRNGYQYVKKHHDYKALAIKYLDVIN